MEGLNETMYGQVPSIGTKCKLSEKKLLLSKMPQSPFVDVPSVIQKSRSMACMWVQAVGSQGTAKCSLQLGQGRTGAAGMLEHHGFP